MKLPQGVRDWLPHELARKRDIEQVLRAVFGRWSYEEVQTPTIERFDVIENGLGNELTELSFQFNDRRSTTLALRPEMTTPIARLVSRQPFEEGQDVTEVGPRIQEAPKGHVPGDPGETVEPGHRTTVDPPRRAGRHGNILATAQAAPKPLSIPTTVIPAAHDGVPWPTVRSPPPGRRRSRCWWERPPPEPG